MTASIRTTYAVRHTDGRIEHMPFAATARWVAERQGGTVIHHTITVSDWKEETL